MIQLFAIQARFGDCFLLVYGNEEPRYMLIDGGPAHNFDDHLKYELEKLKTPSLTLDCVIISHVDNDHIIGVLDLFAHLKYAQDAGKEPLCKVKKMWFNSFSATLDSGDLEDRINAINKIAGVNNIRMQEMSMTLNGIREGHQLITFARFLEIPVNPEVTDDVLLADQAARIFNESNLEVIVVGPTSNNLEKLQKKWEEWIAENEQKIEAGQYTREFAAMQDRSIPNLSSIILVVKADGKTILLTGDCRGDHLQEGLIETGLSADGKIHVDIFKVPHHGSQRNVTKEFFSDVTADTYVISADGTNGNPDVETLTWIVESAREAGREIEIIFTNHTGSTDALMLRYPPANSGYKVRFLPPGEKSIQIV